MAGAALLAMGMVVGLSWLMSPSVDKDLAFEAKSAEDTFGYKVTRYSERPSIFFPTRTETWKTLEWPNPGMNKAWNGTLCTVYYLPLTKAGYEQCEGRVWGETSRL